MSDIRATRNALLVAIDTIDRTEFASLGIEESLDCVRDHARRIARQADISVRTMAMAALTKRTGTPAATVRIEVDRALALAYAAEGGLHEVRRVKDVLSDAPCGDDTILPPDVEVSRETGTFLYAGRRDGQVDRVLVSPVPIIVCGRVRLLDDSDTEELELAFYRDGRWHIVILPREVACDSRQILRGVAARGLPLTDAKAKHLVRLVDLFETHNLTTLRTAPAVKRTGWHKHQGQEFFALGELAIGLNGEAIRLAVSTAERRPLSCLRAHGTVKDWAAGIGSLVGYPRIVFCVYVSLAAPLLRWASSPNFLVHNGGESSTGKTLASRVAGSVWGWAGDNDGLVATWDGTTNFAAKLATLFGDLPVMLDDSQTEQPNRVQEAIFRIASGRDRGRLNRDSTMQEQASYRCVTITTGEQNLLDSTQYSGGAARMVSFWGGTLPPNRPELADAITDFVRGQYGTAGPAYLDRVVDIVRTDRDRISPEAVRAQAERLKVAVRGELTGTSWNIAGRAASYFGLALVAAEIAHELFGWVWDPFDIVVRCFRDALGGYTGPDAAAKAYEEAQSWITANRSNFWNGGDNCSTPHTGWLGVWEPSISEDNPDYARVVAVRPDVLRRALVSWGYPDPRSIFRHWKDRRWLRTNAKDRETCRVSMATERPWMYAVVVPNGLQMG